MWVVEIKPQIYAGAWIVMPLLRLLDLYVHVIVSMCLLCLVDVAGILTMEPIKNGMD